MCFQLTDRTRSSCTCKCAEICKRQLKMKNAQANLKREQDEPPRQEHAYIPESASFQALKSLATIR